MQARHRLIAAIDTDDRDHARALVARLASEIGGVKLGLQFFCAHGPDGVKAIMADHRLPLWLDLKFHDIPNTAALAVRAVVALQPAVLTLHASGGLAMLRACVQSVEQEAGRLAVARPRLLAVTVLTSLDQLDLLSVGQGYNIKKQVLLLSTLARDAGLDGVVCAAEDIDALRTQFPAPFLFAVPGIRPAWATANHDQKRAMTPDRAVSIGADYLIIGRPLTQAENPTDAARRTALEIAAAETGARA